MGIEQDATRWNRPKVPRRLLMPNTLDLGHVRGSALRRTAFIRVVVTLVVLTVLTVAYLAFAPRGSRADLAMVQASIESREGRLIRVGTFERLVSSDNQPPDAVVIDGRRLQVAEGFQIWRALMRRPIYAFTPRLVLLELPDWQAWNDYSGSEALYESSNESAAVTRVIIIEDPR